MVLMHAAWKTIARSKTSCLIALSSIFPMLGWVRQFILKKTKNKKMKKKRNQGPGSKRDCESTTLPRILCVCFQKVEA
jgi:hypothetical protein